MRECFAQPMHATVIKLALTHVTLAVRHRDNAAIIGLPALHRYRGQQYRDGNESAMVFLKCVSNLLFVIAMDFFKQTCFRSRMPFSSHF